MIVFNTIILMLIFDLLLNLLFKPKREALHCGLFGWVSQSVNWNPLSKFKFELLGVDNDFRGGDGVGIAFDGTVVKGTDPKKFDDFWRLDKVPDAIGHNAIIGHDRKASIGAQTFENTQPIFFENLNTILAHNGTISNFKEMYNAHKIKDHFDYNIVGMSDSQVMGLLMEKSGWSVLNEYTGSMAFLYMRGDEPGIIYAYHGASKLRKFAQVNTEERPLYYGIEDGQTWFCSTKAPLEKIIKDKKSIWELPFNKVFRFDGNSMVEIYAVDRSKQTQFEETTVVYSNSKYKDEIDYADELPSKNWKNWNKHVNGNIKSFEEDTYATKTPNYLYYEGGYFKINEKKADGLICIANTGRLLTQDEYYSGLEYNFYLWEGNICKDEEAYFNILKIAATDDFINSPPARKLWLIGSNFANPFMVESSKGVLPTSWMYSNTPMSSGQCTQLFSGTLLVPFSSKILKIMNGKLGDVFVDNYLTITPISPYQVLTPDLERLEELQMELAYKMYDGITPEETLMYDCPICLTCGTLTLETGGQMECPACGGEGKLLKSTLEEYLTSTAKLSDLITDLGIAHDEEKVLNMVNHIIDIGLDILEEKSVFFSEDLINKLTEMKITLWAK